MKFKDIKVGDTVYVQRVVGYRFNRQKSFWVPSIVTRTTATQFLIGEERYKKDTGRSTGNRSFQSAAALGDQSGYGGKVVDQTKERDDFLRRLKAADDTIDIALEFKSKLSIGHPRLFEIHEKALQLQKLLEDNGQKEN